MDDWQSLLDGDVVRKHEAWLQSRPEGRRLIIESRDFVQALGVGNDYRLAGFLNSRFSESNFTLATMTALEASACEFTQSNLEFCQLDDSRLSRVWFRSCHMVGVHLERAQIDAGGFPSTNLARSTFRSATLRGVDLSDAFLALGDFRSARFLGCKFHRVDFSEVLLGDVEFDLCNFQDANFQKAELSGVKFCDCQQLSL